MGKRRKSSTSSVKDEEENGMESNFDVEIRAYLYLNGRSLRACEKKRKV